MDQVHLKPEPQAGLARIAVLENKLKEALELVDQILRVFEDYDMNGCEEPLRVYMTCFRVLEANHDPRGEDILNKAYALLEQRASMIEEPDLRKSFLENVEVNKEIIKAFENFKWNK